MTSFFWMYSHTQKGISKLSFIENPYPECYSITLLLLNYCFRQNTRILSINFTQYLFSNYKICPYIMTLQLYLLMVLLPKMIPYKYLLLNYYILTILCVALLLWYCIYSKIIYNYHHKITCTCGSDVIVFRHSIICLLTPKRRINIRLTKDN